MQYNRKLAVNVLATYREHKIVFRAISSAIKNFGTEEVVVVLPHDYKDDIYLCLGESLLKTICNNSCVDLKIIPFKWCDSFCKARNIALENTNSELVLWLDADDVVADIDSKGTKELREIFDKNYDSIDMYDVVYNCYGLAGDKEKTIRKAKIIKRETIKFEKDIHEMPVPINKDKIVKGYIKDVEIDHKPIKDPKISCERNIKMTERLIKKYPNDIHYKFNYANDLIREGRDVEVMPTLVELLQSKQTSITAKCWAALKLSRSYHKEFSMQLTETYARIALSYFDDIPETYCILANVYHTRGCIDDAITLYNIALSKKIGGTQYEGDIDVRYYVYLPATELSRIHLHLGEFEKALLYNKYALNTQYCTEADKQMREKIIRLLKKSV